MATIDIRRSHSLSMDVVRTRAEELAKDMATKLGIRWRWDGDRIEFDAPSGMAKGASGAVIVDGANVRVEVDLPFLLRPMKGTVESKINSKLDNILK
jgi:putative polyhydroxyalkanoate system protein